MSDRSSRRRLMALVVVCVAAALGANACASLPRRADSGARQADYFATRPELPPKVSRAMEDGHILLGMDVKQVWVVLGDPVRKTRFARRDVEVWIYRGASLHQDHYKLGSDLVRLIFLKNRLVVIESM